MNVCMYNFGSGVQGLGENFRKGFSGTSFTDRVKTRNSQKLKSAKISCQRASKFEISPYEHLADRLVSSLWRFLC